jgi:MFS family permease
MIAPFFGGMLIDQFGIVNGVRLALLVSIALSGATIIVQWQLREQSNGTARLPAAGGSRLDRWNFWRALHEFSPPMRRLLFSDILVRFCERIPYAWVVIFAMDYIGMNGEQIGLLTAVEMAAAMLCIIPAAHYADRHGREPFVIVTFIMFTLFPIALLMSRSFSALVVAFAIRGLKEFGDTSRKALIIGYSDSERRGQIIGAYYLVRDLIVSMGAILGAYLWNLGPALNFLGAAALGGAGTVFYIKTIRQARRSDLNTLKKQLARRRSRRN